MKKIKRKNGTLIFSVDGQDVLPAAYMTYCPQDGDYDSFYAMGYRLFSYCVYAGDCPVNEYSGLAASFEAGLWRAEDIFDFTPLDRGMQRIAGAQYEREVYVLLRINLNMPQWWREKHPQECMHYGTRCGMQSIASAVWRRDAALFLARLHDHIAVSLYARHIIGWQVAAMHTEEWLFPNMRFDDWTADAPLLNYLNAQAVRHYDALPLAAVEEKRKYGRAAKDCAVAQECLRALNRATAEAICYFAACVKELHHGDIFCGAFYGYMAQCNDLCGHHAFSTVLADPNIDFFASPFGYTESRGMAVDWIYHAPMQTVSDAGKIWLLEADVRTHLTCALSKSRPDLAAPDLAYFRAPVFFGPDKENSKSNILRSFAKVLTSHHGFWWFDMWGGWYADRDYHALHEKLLSLYRARMEMPCHSVSEVALLLDEEAAYGLSDAAFDTYVYRPCVALGFLGAPYDILLLSEMTRERLSAYRLVICPAPSVDVTALHPRILQSGEDLPLLDRDRLQREAAAAGVHLYAKGHLVYADSAYLALTATADGDISVSLPCGSLQDALTGQVFRPQNGLITLPAVRNRCFLFRRGE